MTASILDGKKIAQALQDELKINLDKIKVLGHRAPSLAVILMGHDPASEIYVARKKEACRSVGIRSEIHRLKNTDDEQALIALINTLNNDDSVDGVLVQLPLPAHIHTENILDVINPHKDVDGFHAVNIGRLAQGRPLLRPCTPYAVMKLLESTKVALSGLHAVVVGASNIVGKPMGLELLFAGCTVSTCHEQTRDLKNHVEQADILISAVGKPNLIPGDWIKPGSIVIDVGITRLENGHVVGDIEFESASKKAAWITPVPGGVGPMTVAILLANTVQAASTKLVIQRNEVT